MLHFLIVLAIFLLVVFLYKYSVEALCMFEVNNGVAQINGIKGKYDNEVKDPSTRYGRNAVENLYTYLEQPIINDNMATAPILDFSTNPKADEANADKLNKFLKENDEYLSALPPLQYEYRYMPQMPKGQIDKKAVLGAAYEEMGKVNELSVEEMDYRFAPDDSFTSKALDINNDGKIDNGEYATSILAADMLSKSDTPDMNNIDGTINKKGFDAVLAYTQKSKAAAAAALYSNIYNNYKLGEN